jgi:hypothetical protein
MYTGRPSYHQYKALRWEIYLVGFMIIARIVDCYESVLLKLE